MMKRWAMWRIPAVAATPSARRPAAVWAARIAASSGAGGWCTSSKYCPRWLASSAGERQAGVTSTRRNSAARSASSREVSSIARWSSARIGWRAGEGRESCRRRPMRCTSSSMSAAVAGVASPTLQSYPRDACDHPRAGKALLMDSELPGRAAQTRIYRDGAFGVTPKVPVGPERLERAAHEAMSARAWAYIAGSAGMETTAGANRAAFAKWEIVPRMLRDVAERDLGIELFGRRRRTPFLFSPIGVLEMVSREADLAVARAARRLEVPMVISTQGSRSMEQISAEMGDAERWYQLYWSNNDDLVASMVRRAEACGATAIVVTLDTHTLGWRTRDLDIAFLPFARGQGIAQYT